MKIPKEKTIRGKMNAYAYRAGFTLHPKKDGTYSLFNIKMKCYTHEHICMDSVVRVVVDKLHAMGYVYR